ncbi:MAG: class I tRNA ligase family protein, partial [Chloroflexi bacterium]|nr:class I tRNA ligase family protein [Chloroflexota bacterium]
FWSEFADWYIEVAKLQLAAGGDRAWSTLDTLVTVLDQCLRMLHPFTPYVTEEIWQHLRSACLEPNKPKPSEGWVEALIVAKWPDPTSNIQLPDNDFPHIMDLIRAIRNARAENKVEMSKKIAAMIVSEDKTVLIESQREIIARLAIVDSAQLTISAALAEKPKQAVAIVIGTTEIYLPLAGMVDADAEKEKLGKQIADLDKQIEKLEKLLGSDFVNKAPPNVVEKEKQRLAEAKETRGKMRERLG